MNGKRNGISNTGFDIFKFALQIDKFTMLKIVYFKVQCKIGKL